MSYEERKNGWAGLVRLFKHVIFVKSQTFSFPFNIDYKSYCKFLEASLKTSRCSNNHRRLFETFVMCFFTLVLRRRYIFENAITLPAFPPLTRLTVHWQPSVWRVNEIEKLDRTTFWQLLFSDPLKILEHFEINHQPDTEVLGALPSFLWGPKHHDCLFWIFLWKCLLIEGTSEGF